VAQPSRQCRRRLAEGQCASARQRRAWYRLQGSRAASPLIGDARIVSLGEATHGTREFFKLKHRMIEYCVSQLGFTMIGFEAEYGATLAVNDYVLNGKGNAVDVVAGMGFWTWDTEEVVELVEWVRAWNIANARKVKFYGFDMQSSPASGMHLLAYLERVAPHLAAVCEQNIAPLASAYAADDLRLMRRSCATRPRRSSRLFSTPCDPACGLDQPHQRVGMAPGAPERDRARSVRAHQRDGQ
jgi:erythromycin esterase-like protein